MLNRLWIGVLLLGGVHAAHASVELHVCTLGPAAEKVGLKFDDGSPAMEIEATDGYLSGARLLPGAIRADIFLAPDEAGKQPLFLGKILLPKEGRHLLLIAHPIKGRPTTHFIPFDSAAHPPGSVGFLNLTSRKVRCFIEAESVELDPASVKTMPTTDTARRIVNHRLELKTKQGWKTENSTTLVLSAKRRFLFVLQEDSPQSMLSKTLVMDFDPEHNLAPLSPPAVRAEPPLPDPPAK